jgi:hypothetical protein
METKFALRYSGQAVESGLMDVYEASANMIAFSDFVVFSAKAAYGANVEARAAIAGFGRGSFITNLVFDVVGTSSSIFTNVDPHTLWSLVKESIGLWKMLKGSPPSRVDYQGQAAVVTNNHGEIKQVSIGALTVVFSDKGGESAEQFIHKALAKEGLDAIEIAADDRLLDRVSQSESKYFVPVAPSKTITDVIVRMGLVLGSPVFKDDNKWRFYDGQQSFYAHVEDREFLARVDAGEPFRKGDVIIADVRINQQQSGMKLVAERAIAKVLEHKAAPRQLSLS